MSYYLKALLPNQKFMRTIFSGKVLIILFIAILCFLFYLSYSIPQKIEGFASQNNSYNYYPDKSKLNTNFTYHINDVLSESNNMICYIKTYKKLTKKPSCKSSEYNNEYIVSISDNELYKYYNELVSNSDKEMDAIYKEFIDKPIDVSAFNKLLSKFGNTAITYDVVKYTMLNEPEKRPNTDFNGDSFANYFIDLYNKYKGRQSELNEIKTFLYNIYRPIHVYNQFIEHFISNQTVYNEADHALYVINTTMSTLNLKYDGLRNEMIAYIIEKDSTDKYNSVLTSDAIILFQMISILKIFSKTVLNSTTLYIKDKDDFVDSYSKYIKKSSTPAENSLLLYVYNNPPNENIK